MGEDLGKRAAFYFVLRKEKLLNILVIDDNEDITELLDMVLTAMGNKISFTNDGKERLMLIRENKYDAILLDIAMPTFSGVDIINALEKDGTIKNYNIILFTASSIKDSAVDELLSKGVRGIIRKPIEVEELVEQINKLV